ncbi:MAG: hypothetical protein M1820_004278 [Bogoriella megaspora]|nr:MAG: hypothetical protein M1820_004278 [Bogoriella megaspora]
MRGRGIYHPQSVSLRHGNTDEIHISRRIQRTKAPDADLLDETLVPLFARLNVGAVISGHHASDVSCTDPAAVRAFPTSFTSIEEAWQELVKLLHHALKFVLQASSKRYSRTFTTEDLAFHSHLLSQMAHWLRLVKDFERNNDKEDLSENTLLCSARLQHQCAWIWLSCCTDPLEMKYDNYMDGFREIFSIGKVLVSNSLLRTPDSEFDFAYDLEYVAPLFFGAMKCRDPILRRHFVQLLDRRKRWESIWDSERCACMARRLIALEESGLCGSSVHKYPPARYRIHEHQMSIDRPSFKATFHSLPSGLGSELYTWVETWHI